MTLNELYGIIDGDYEQALKVLRIDKLIDKHIRRFPTSGVADALVSAAVDMDHVRLFETAHALKGVCANLGLIKMYELASAIAEEYRPGNARRLSDEQVKETIGKIGELYKKTTEGVRLYEQSL